MLRSSVPRFGETLVTIVLLADAGLRLDGVKVPVGFRQEVGNVLAVLPIHVKQDFRVGGEAFPDVGVVIAAVVLGADVGRGAGAHAGLRVSVSVAGTGSGREDPLPFFVLVAIAADGVLALFRLIGKLETAQSSKVELDLVPLEIGVGADVAFQSGSGGREQGEGKGGEEEETNPGPGGGKRHLVLDAHRRSPDSE